MKSVWAGVREAIERHGRVGLVSVIGETGSVPRGAGARIVLHPDGGFYGSIGGGRLEYEVLIGARQAIETGRCRAELRKWPLGPNLGQCCGGMVTTLVETFDVSDLAEVRRLEELEHTGRFTTLSRLDDNGRVVRAVGGPVLPVIPRRATANAAATQFSEEFGEACKPLLLFGAGHVGRALVLALAALPFDVRWIDGRLDQFPQHVPQNVTTILSEKPEQEIAQAPRSAIAVVMTHSHPLDFQITIAALKRATFAYVGLIGSKTKRARLASLGRQLGLGDAEIERLVCPIGIREITGKEPPVIAAAVAAQLLALPSAPQLAASDSEPIESQPA